MEELGKRVKYEKVNRVEMGMCLYISACPNGKPFLLCERECQFAKCPADPSASCFSDPCNKCKVEFCDAQEEVVNCTQGEYLHIVSGLKEKKLPTTTVSCLLTKMCFPREWFLRGIFFFSELSNSNILHFCLRVHLKNHNKRLYYR